MDTMFGRHTKRHESGLSDGTFYLTKQQQLALGHKNQPIPAAELESAWKDALQANWELLARDNCWVIAPDPYSFGADCVLDLYVRGGALWRDKRLGEMASTVCGIAMETL